MTTGSAAATGLSAVTLVAVDGTMNPSATLASLADAAAVLAFGRVLLLSAVEPATRPGLDHRYQWRPIPPLTLKGYNQFCLAELHRHIETSHCLTIQSDSRIVNPSAWDDGWLEYDYIGAPWPPGHTGTPFRVGNSGFALRSRRLLAATAELPNDSYVWRGERKASSRDDVITCVMLPHAPRAARIAFRSGGGRGAILVRESHARGSAAGRPVRHARAAGAQAGTLTPDEPRPQPNRFNASVMSRALTKSMPNAPTSGTTR